jgi:PTH1 family peptidyl-tRNA hydrolase
MVLSKIAHQNDVLINNRRKHSVTAKTIIGEHNIILALPTTYMNNSGDAVIDILKTSTDVSSELLIIYDDKDLPLGTIRLKPNGSSGGHNGIKSVISSLGTDQFPRLRIGIGSESHISQSKMIDFVLADFGRSERTVLDSAIDKAVKCVEKLIDEGIERAMNEFN